MLIKIITRVDNLTANTFRQASLEESIRKFRKNLEDGVWFVRKNHSSRKSLASAGNRQAILGIDKELEILGKSLTTRMNYINFFHEFAEFLGETAFKDAVKEKLIDYFATFKDQKGSTCNHRMIVIKLLYRRLNGGENPDCTSWIKPKIYKNYVTSEAIPTPDEIEAMITKAGSFRDKAIIMVLWESACRISEFLGMKISDIAFDRDGARVRVSGKTGEREIRLVNSIPYLREWLKIHPLKDGSNSYVWVTNNGKKPLTENGVNSMLKKLKIKCGIQKRMHPHIFRHTRITELAAKLTGTMLNNYVGWKTSSNMSEVYVHHKRNEIDTAVLNNVYNIKNIDRAEEVVERLLPQTCFNCGERNMPELSYCTKCRMPLDEDEFKHTLQQNMLVMKHMFPMSPEVFKQVVQQEVRKAVEKLMELRAR